MKRPTLQQIADAAGVTRAAVSLALRNSPRISVEMRRKIAALAESLGYRPDPMISTLMANLRGRRTSATVLGYISFFTRREQRRITAAMRYIHGAAERARHLGFLFEVFTVSESGVNEERLGRILYARNVQGVLLSPVPTPRPTVGLPWERLGAVALGFSIKQPAIHRSVNHQVYTCRLALEQLTALGYRRIGLALSVAADARVQSHWQGAFLVYQQGLPPKQRVPLFLDAEWKTQRLLHWFRQHRPDAVLTLNAETRDVLVADGIRIPEDTAFCILDRSPEHHGLAGIDQRPEAVGAAGVDLIVEQLNNNERGIPPEPKIVLTTGIWVDGASAPPCLTS